MPTVLCIDDAEAGLRIRKYLLELQGYNVLTATDGQTGIELAAAHKIDAMILDYRMPSLSGEDVARIIKSRWPALPIIMLSGHLQVPESAHGLVDAFVVKGTPPSVLYAELERLIGVQTTLEASTERRSEMKTEFNGT